MKYFFAAAMAMCLIIASCGKVTPDINDPIKTGEATQITQNSAVLWGAVDPSALGQGVEMGIIYSDSENPSVENGIIRVSRELDKDNKFFVEAKGLTAGTKFYYRAFLNIGGIYRVGDVKRFTTEAFKYAFVDLGLPSGLKWATCNVGATAPEEYGDYYAWGEVEPKSAYSWSTYTLCNGSTSTLTKYNYNNSFGTVDNKIALDPEDDAAAVNRGGTWRVPTDEEWKELRTKCTWTWTKRSGVNGRLVTGPNGKSIFLPAAGYWNNTYLSEAGSYGIYWSSSLSMEYPISAWRVFFNMNVVYENYSVRYFGQSVRPVTE